MGNLLHAPNMVMVNVFMSLPCMRRTSLHGTLKRGGSMVGMVTVSVVVGTMLSKVFLSFCLGDRCCQYLQCAGAWASLQVEQARC